MDWFFARLREPSTYAGMAGLAAALGISDTIYASVSAALVAVFGALAVIVSERKPKP
jgi:hypothetical protein